MSLSYISKLSQILPRTPEVGGKWLDRDTRFCLTSNLRSDKIFVIMVCSLIAHAIGIIIELCYIPDIGFENYIPNILDTIGFRLSISQNANFRKNPHGKDHNPRGRAI